jgi:hypothetical protein
MHDHGRTESASRWALAVVVAIGMTLLGAGPAHADSASMTVTATDGTPDPVADVSRVFTIAGTATAPKDLFVKYRAVGGAPCATTYLEDTGVRFGWSYQGVNGAFSLKHAATWGTPGSFMFCYWLAADDDVISTPFTQVITFRPPSGTITATFNPIMPLVNQLAIATITGSTETPAQVFGKVRPAGGAACAPTFLQDSGRSVIGYENVNGAFSKPATVTQAAAGNHVLCLWLADSDSDPTPISGPQPQPFTVLAPPRQGSKITLTRRSSRPARYGGRVTTVSTCRRNRTVVLRRVGRGTRSFGRTATRSDGTYTIRRSRRVRGRVYTYVSTSRRGATTCLSASSRRIAG